MTPNTHPHISLSIAAMTLRNAVSSLEIALKSPDAETVFFAKESRNDVELALQFIAKGLAELGEVVGDSAEKSPETDPGPPDNSPG